MNLQQKMAVVVLDVLLIVELCVSMFFAARNPDYLTPVFVKSFLFMVIPTLIVARIVIKSLGTKSAEVSI